MTTIDANRLSNTRALTVAAVCGLLLSIGILTWNFWPDGQSESARCIRFCQPCAAVWGYNDIEPCHCRSCQISQEIETLSRRPDASAAYALPALGTPLCGTKNPITEPCYGVKP